MTRRAELFGRAVQAEGPAVQADFAATWQDSYKVVYSTTLADPVTKRTRIVGTLPDMTIVNRFDGVSGIPASEMMR